MHLSCPCCAWPPQPSLPPGHRTRLSQTTNSDRQGSVLLQELLSLLGLVHDLLGCNLLARTKGCFLVAKRLHPHNSQPCPRLGHLSRRFRPKHILSVKAIFLRPGRLDSQALDGDLARRGQGWFGSCLFSSQLRLDARTNEIRQNSRLHCVAKATIDASPNEC